MKCPFCGHQETAVLESRTSENGDVFRRRRECAKCKKRFTTYERVEKPSLFVIKKDGRREPFSREKLSAGIIKACQKRPVGIDQIGALVNGIERELLKKDSVEIPSKVIGNLVMKKLKKLDKVAFVRFASIYREFQDVSDFDKAVKGLK